MSQTHDTVIVFAIDFSEMTDYVIESALAYAATFQRPSVHAICVIEPSKSVLASGQSSVLPEELEHLDETVRARMASALASAGHPLDEQGDWTVTSHARSGSPAEVIADLAAEVRASTIIVGRHGSSGFRPFLLGSVPSRLLVLARCTMMVVQPPAYHDE